MSTQRFDSTSDIISSDSTKTSRGADGIISSDYSDQSTGLNSIDLNNKKYQVIRKIASSGEAEIYLVDHEGKQQVIKYYYNRFKPKDEIVRKLQSIGRKDIIVPLDYGLYQDRFVEVNEYMSGGTLGNLGTTKNIGTIKKLVTQITDAIHHCHEKGIIHRDIKPVNIFFRDETQQEIVLGDFGIASNLQAGESYVVTVTARTSTYAAPELFTNINNLTTLDPKVDYYALGITLLELWMGQDPFEGIHEFNIMRIKNEGRVLIPPDMDDTLQSLIKGLITTEPPRRWGYEEVQKWLRGEFVKNYYETTREIKFSNYEFDGARGIIVDNPKELAYHMEQNHQKAIRQLYANRIAQWIEPTSQDLYSEIVHITERAYPNTSAENEEAGITKTIYLLDRDRIFKSFDGTELSSPKEMGNHIEQHSRFFIDELKKPTAKLYLFLEARGFQERADKFRKYFAKLDAEKALNLVILDLQENKLQFNGDIFENPGQFNDASESTKEELVQQFLLPNSKVSIWLDANFNDLGANLLRWRKLNKHNFNTLGYALRTKGFVLNNREVYTTEEFSSLFADSVKEFTDSPQADANREDADYWLSNVHAQPLSDFVVHFLETQPCEYNDYGLLYEYLMKKTANTKPYSITEKLAKSINSVTGDNVPRIQSILNITSYRYIQYLENERPNKVFAIENLLELMSHLKKMKSLNPSFGEALLLAMNDKIDTDIHDDINRIKKNSDTFIDYYDGVKSFVSIDLADFPNLPYLAHWKKEQELIRRNSQKIESRITHETEKDVKEIHKTTVGNIQETLSREVNFLIKGKKFYKIFMYSISIASLFLFGFLYRSESIPPQAKTSLLLTGLAFTLIPFLLGRNAWRRPPNRGLGYILDPVHAFVGRQLYKPFIKKIYADANNPLNKKFSTLENNALQQTTLKNDGKKKNEIFEETVRIALLTNDQLDAEYSKI